LSSAMPSITRVAMIPPNDAQGSGFRVSGFWFLVSGSNPTVTP
jgi:hypothetical protein